MGVPSYSFEGIETNIPGVYSKSEYPPSPGSGAARTNVVAVIGSCEGGIPYNATDYDEENRANIISSTAQALDILRGGPGYYMTEFYLTPTKDAALNLPTEALVFRVDPAVQATGTLKDVGSNTIISLESQRYGTLANQITRKVEAATTLGHKATVKFQGATIAEQDNIGFEYMAIQYVGVGTAATMTIDATQLTTTVTGDTPSNLTLLFADFSKLGDLVAYIDEQPNYTCRLLYQSNTLTTTFDAVTTTDIKTAEYTAVAHVEALIQFFNKQCQNELRAELFTGAVRTNVVNDANFVFLTGGAKGTATSTDWANTLTLMEKFKINHILCATGDSSIHAMVDAHVQSMSSIENKRNRAMSTGALLAKTQSEKINEAKVLNSARTEYHVTPFSRADVVNNGIITEFDPFYGAALTAGIRYGNNVTISATFKTINVVALSEKYDTSTRKLYITAGCSLFGKEDRGFTVIHNVTTAQETNLILNLPSMLRTADAITLDAQGRIQARIAALTEAPTALVIQDMQNFLATNLLPDYRDSKHWLTDDPLSGEKAFSDIQFALMGDRFDFSFTGIIPAPLHFVFVKQKFLVPGFSR